MNILVRSNVQSVSKWKFTKFATLVHYTKRNETSGQTRLAIKQDVSKNLA